MRSSLHIVSKTEMKSRHHPRTFTFYYILGKVTLSRNIDFCVNISVNMKSLFINFCVIQKSISEDSKVCEILRVH